MAKHKAGVRAVWDYQGYRSDMEGEDNSATCFFM